MIQGLLFKFGLNKILKYKSLAIILLAVVLTFWFTRDHYTTELENQANIHLLDIAERNKRAIAAQLRVERDSKISGEAIVTELNQKLADISKGSEKIIREVRNVPVNTDCSIDNDFVELFNAQLEAGNTGPDNSDGVPSATGNTNEDPRKAAPPDPEVQPATPAVITQQDHIIHSAELVNACGAIRQQLIGLQEFINQNYKDNKNTDE